MGIPDSSLLDLVEKVRSWISWRGNESCLSGKFVMPDNNRKMCCECDTSFTDVSKIYHCQNCGRQLCENCIQGYESYVGVLDGVKADDQVEKTTRLCKFCCNFSTKSEVGRKYGEKVHPSASPRESPEPPSPCFNGERIKCPYNLESIQSDHLGQYLGLQDFGYSPQSGRTMSSFSAHPSPVSVRRSPSRSDEEEAEDTGRHFFSPLSDYSRESLDIDSSSINAGKEFDSCSVGSSPADSPARANFSSSKVGKSVQQGQGGSPMCQNDSPFGQETMAAFKRPMRGTDGPENTDDCSVDLPTIHTEYETLQRPLDFENNGLIWFPPPPDDENDDAESNFFAYDDEDDNIGDSGVMFSTSSSFPSMFPSKEKLNEGHKEPLRAVVQGHFRALVAQLLQGEGMKNERDDGVEDWLDIVTTIAWQAANFVRPDTSRGGSMDPGDYVKVKCIASGSPSESTFIKGVVCTKNIKHKRMTTQYKNPRLLLLGGSLEYQRVPNQLASFDTLLQQEKDHLKMIISKIEALRPNVLLVEKSVSSCAQEYLLAREISLVLNVKRSLLERIARCTGALITPSIDNISAARLGHCELFRLEKVSEDHENVNQFNKKPSKTLMFFEGCPRRLGCTVLLRGMCREELKKVKHVVQYAVFAAYHLSLETSFLVDEGASLPKMTLKHPAALLERDTADVSISVAPNDIPSVNCHDVDCASAQNGLVELCPELEELTSAIHNPDRVLPLFTGTIDCKIKRPLYDSCSDDVAFDLSSDLCSLNHSEDLKSHGAVQSDVKYLSESETQKILGQEKRLSVDIHDPANSEGVDENDVSSEYISATDTHQSILVSFSSHCVLKGTVCERSRLLRIKFYGCFDKPLGRYLRDDLFDQSSCCRYCKESVDAHVLCFTHQQGNLTINVRRLPSMKLPGEQDGKIWMWHRCLKCAHIDGVPPATRRVVMSDAAWGLSFGKFLELSFSNHATANRVANCGHSLQRDCLRYYGFGSMVAFFRYSPIDILSVHLPPSLLEFNGHIQPEWMRREASELINKMETVYAEISDIIDSMELKSRSLAHQFSDTTDIQNHIMQLKDLLKRERTDYIDLLQPVMMETSKEGMIALDILEVNRLRRSLLIGSYFWDRRLYSLDSLLKRSSNTKTAELKDERRDVSCEVIKLGLGQEEIGLQPEQKEESKVQLDGENFDLHGSTLSERIDSAWSGTDQIPLKASLLPSQSDEFQVDDIKQMNHSGNPHVRKLMSPVRVHSFDSAIRIQERMRKGLPPSTLHLSTIRSFHASGDYRHMVRDPVSNVTRTYSETLPWETQKLNLILSSAPCFISSVPHIAEGVRLLLSQKGNNDMVIAVYDNEPTSIISYALSSKEYEDWVSDRSDDNEGSLSMRSNDSHHTTGSNLSAWQSFGSLDLDYINYGSYGTEDSSSSIGTLFMDPKKSPHLRISFGDDYSASGAKVKFSVTCYFAKQFDSLRKKCCPSEVDFIRSLSRCRRWSAQGGKSNVYFAKSLDERFIVKQVTKTELDSFEDFAPEYFKYLSDSLNSGSPTCLAKILGIFQVTVKHLKGGKEMKMDLMVMENLFFKRSISRIYDLKGSARSRYNSDTTGTNKVLLDMNLLETLSTKPIFLRSKAKRSLERAIWNDTSFLASVDVMDYSLLVGVDEERKELVLGIIDFMRQYTWDKHLETWVKASGILGGPKNASPTIVSPKQYKKRFRKAMTSYFLTVPDQWSP